MQYPSHITQGGYPTQGSPPKHPPFGHYVPSNYPSYGFYPPFYPYGFNSFPYMPPMPSVGGSFYNSGGNVNESGTQTNGSVIVGNHSEEERRVRVASIGGNHDNDGGQQRSGKVTVGDIGRFQWKP